MRSLVLVALVVPIVSSCTGAVPTDSGAMHDAIANDAFDATLVDITPTDGARDDAALDVVTTADVFVGNDAVEASMPDAVGSDGGLPAPTCEPVRLTYYDVSGGGACEVMDAPTALSDSARMGLTFAIAEAWSGGSFGGGPMAACGECWEVTTADAQRVLTVTDLCPVAGNPLCAGGFFHFDVARTAATQLGYLSEGIVAASARRVACPVNGSIRAVVRDQNPWFLRLALANMRVGVRAVSVRGAGPGVDATNPWMPMARDGGAWSVTASSMMLARGGTGVSLRIESGQGQIVESTAIIPTSATLRTVVDLGVQLDDLAPSGGVCMWRPPTDIFVDGFGGIDRVRWSSNAWAGATTTDAAYSTNCAGGTCLRFANVGQYSGFALFYPQAFSRTGFTRVAFRARSNAARNVAVVLADGAMRCTEQSVSLTTAWQRFEIDLAARCGSIATLKTLEMRNDGANGAEIVLDDVVLE